MAWTQTYTAVDADGNALAEQPAQGATLGEGESWQGNGDWTFTAEPASQERYSAASVTPEGDNDSSLERERAEQAAAAGVRDARFVGYAEVLANYANRSDVETLAERRARHLGTDPAQQSFTRAADYDAGAGTSDAPQTEYPGVTTAWTEEDHTPAPEVPEGG